MERDWTDRDGQAWHVRAYNAGGGMASGGGIPDPGKDMIRFRLPDGSATYAIETHNLRDPSDMTDEELQELLDRAQESEG
jgi:hypothetical protein